MVRSKIQIYHYELTRDRSIPVKCRETNWKPCVYNLADLVGDYLARLLNSDEALELVLFARMTSDGLRQTLTARRRLKDIKVTIETPVIYA